MPRSRDHTIGIALITASAVVWSTTGLFTRFLTLDAATILVWRGLFGAIGLCAALALLQGRAGFRDFLTLGRPGFAYAVISATGMLCFITALRLTTVAHVAIIYAVVPFLAAALAWLFLRERPANSALIASGAALLGAAVMVGLGHEGSFAGDLLALGMTMCLALMMVVSRRYPSIPTLPAAALSAFLSALASLPFATSLAVAPAELSLLVAFGLVNSALGFSLFLMGSSRIAPVETALISALDAPLAPLWVWLILAERPTQATLVGGTLVFTAVLWHIARQNHPAA